MSTLSPSSYQHHPSFSRTLNSTKHSRQSLCSTATAYKTTSKPSLYRLCSHSRLLTKLAKFAFLHTIIHCQQSKSIFPFFWSSIGHFHTKVCYYRRQLQINPIEGLTACLCPLATLPFWRKLSQTSCSKRFGQPADLSLLNRFFFETTVIMCVWVTREYWTYCGCSVSQSQQKPTCGCSRIIDQGTQTWEGYCNRPQCPNPGR